MILKIQETNGGYCHYFEGDEIEVHRLNINQECEMVKGSTYMLDYEKGNKYHKYQFRILKEGKIIKDLCSNMPTYLMNDVGKTIDKLI